jgi:hypothetical protein
MARVWLGLGHSTENDMTVSQIGLMANRTTTGEGQWKTGISRAFTVDASVKGQGAVSATVQIHARNTPSGPAALLATITLSGTNEAADGFPFPAAFYEYRATVTAISGTGAAVTVTMGG